MSTPSGPPDRTYLPESQRVWDKELGGWRSPNADVVPDPSVTYPHVFAREIEEEAAAVTPAPEPRASEPERPAPPPVAAPAALGGASLVVAVLMAVAVGLGAVLVLGALVVWLL